MNDPHPALRPAIDAWPPERPTAEKAPPRWSAFITRVLVVAAIVVGSGPAAPARAEWAHLGNFADIRAVYQGGDTLWVGTNGGLVLVDLRTDAILERMTAGDRLPDSSVRAIAGRGDGVWVGTDDGLVVFRGQQTRHFESARSPAFSDIRSIDFGPEESVFIGTFGHGVGVLRDDGLERITKADSLLDNKVYAVAPMDTADVYFATSLGLCAYRDSAWVGFQAGAGLPRGEVKSLVRLNGQERFYLLVGGRGVYRFNGRSSIRIRTRDLFPEDDVVALDVGRDGTVWAAGRYGGIGSFRGGAWQSYGAGDADIEQAHWRSCHAGADGAVYFGSADGLVAVVSGGDVRKIRIPSDLPSGYVGHMIEARGKVWLVNGNELLSTRDGTVFNRESEVGAVFDLTVDLGENLWLCTAAGMIHGDGSSWKRISAAIEPRAPIFTAVRFEPSGRLWAGGHDGSVYRYDGWLWVTFAEPGELSAGPVQRIAIDGHGEPWVQTSEGRLQHLEGRLWEAADSSQFAGLAVVDLAVDGDGTPIVATPSQLWRRLANTGGWEPFAPPATPATGRYQVVGVGPRRVILIGAERGLVVFGGAGHVYGARDGLQGRDVASVLLSADQRVWVGFRNAGLSVTRLGDLGVGAGDR